MGPFELADYVGHDTTYFILKGTHCSKPHFYFQTDQISFQETNFILSCCSIFIHLYWKNRSINFARLLQGFMYLRECICAPTSRFQ